MAGYICGILSPAAEADRTSLACGGSCVMEQTAQPPASRGITAQHSNGAHGPRPRNSGDIFCSLPPLRIAVRRRSRQSLGLISASRDCQV